jgi:hypothetical protein
MVMTNSFVSIGTALHSIVIDSITALLGRPFDLVSACSSRVLASSVLELLTLLDRSYIN